MKSVVAVILLAVLAGCSGPAPWSNGGGITTSPPSPLSLNVPSGEWVAFNPLLASDGAFDLHMDRIAYYDGPGINTRDSYECSVTGIGGQWVSDASSYRNFGGTFEGKRDFAGDSWVNVRMGDGRATSNWAAGGSQGPVLATNFHVGNTASDVTIASEAGGSVVARGRYWCLDGPSLWQGGTYKVTHTSFEASELEWHVDAEKGLLVRVETAMSGDLDFALTAPDRTRAVLPDGNDLTFCSPQVGPWTFTLSTRTHIVGTSQLTISILDAADTGFECQGDWRTPLPFGQVGT
jgi:hypothetical protein